MTDLPLWAPVGRADVAPTARRSSYRLAGPRGGVAAGNPWSPQAGLGWAVATGGAPSLHINAPLSGGSWPQLPLGEKALFSFPATDEVGRGWVQDRGRSVIKAGAGASSAWPMQASPLPPRPSRLQGLGKAHLLGKTGRGGREGPPHSFRGLHMSCPGDPRGEMVEVRAPRAVSHQVP